MCLVQVPRLKMLTIIMIQLQKNPWHKKTELATWKGANLWRCASWWHFGEMRWRSNCCAIHWKEQTWMFVSSCATLHESSKIGLSIVSKLKRHLHQIMTMPAATFWPPLSHNIFHPQSLRNCEVWIGFTTRTCGVEVQMKINRFSWLGQLLLYLIHSFVDEEQAITGINLVSEKHHICKC